MYTGGEWERIGEVRKRTDVPLQRRWRRRHAFEALECIGRARRRTDMMELMEPVVNTKCQRRSKRSELVRTR
jgi:hypothetical protein